jgi:ABC-type Fe3+ transport system substrate-binding protein
MIDKTMTVKRFIEHNSQAKAFMKINGFPVESKQFNRMMSIVKLETALKMKRIDFDAFQAEFERFVQAEEQLNATIGINANDERAHRIVGSLPCVVQLPLHKAFERFLKERSLQIDFQFQGASLGPDWMHRIDSDAPSVVMMAPGFEPLFNAQFLQEYGYDEHLRILFDVPYHEDLTAFKDPQQRLHVLSVVPMVLVVNRAVLGERKIPQSWTDLMYTDYAHRIAYPNEDEDLKNALLTYVYKVGGEDAVVRFARNCLLPLHPSQMVKSRRIEQKPAIMIMPYFFAKLAQKEKGFQVVWPEEGALSIPIFLAMDDRMNEQERLALEFFFTQEAGTVFAKQGYFPSSVVGVEHERLGELWWLGWDYIYDHDMLALMHSCYRVFEAARP